MEEDGMSISSTVIGSVRNMPQAKPAENLNLSSITQSGVPLNNSESNEAKFLQIEHENRQLQGGLANMS